MIGMDLLDQGSTGALTRPSVTLDFGGGGGLGGAAGGGASLADGLVSLRLVRGVAPEVDMATLQLVPIVGGAELPAPGDTGTIRMTAGDLSSSFSCIVDMMERRADGSVRITVTNGARLMARARINLAFAEQDPGAIIDAIATEVGATSSAGSVGETLNSYMADDRRSAWDHVVRLAATAERLAGIDDDGKLVLFDDTATGEAVARFVVGESMLDHRVGSRESTVGTVTIDAEGASDKGGNAWAWLRKDKSPVSTTVGSGQPLRRVNAPWLRGQPASQALAETRLRGMDRTATFGRFLVQAAPQVVPGSLIDIAGTVGSDGVWLVLRVTLCFDIATGMTSEIEASPVGSGGFL